MTVQVLAAALAIVGASLVLGQAFSLAGLRCRTIAPAVGLSGLILIAGIAVRLPGGATTAAAALLIALVASVGVIIRRSDRVRFPGVPLAAGAIAACGAAIPFIANGRWGLPGVSLDNDTASHLIYAETLQSSFAAHLYGIPQGYPLGPHSLVAALSHGLRIQLDLAFTGLLIAIVIVTAVVATAALAGEARWKRVVVGALASLVYLVAAYYAEGAFKEPLMGLLLLAMVLQLEEAVDRWSPGLVSRWLAFVPTALLLAAGIYVYSYLAVAWFGLTLVIWLAAEAAIRPSRLRRWRLAILPLVGPAVIAGALVAILVAPIIDEIFSFARQVGTSPAGTGAITVTNLGNLAHALSPYEALGIWNSPDFRLFPTNVFHAGELSALALGVLLLGWVWSVSRREFLLPAAVVACAIIYWRSSQDQSPYVTAKALVIAGPVIVVTGMRGLLRSPSARPRWSIRLGRLALAAIFISLAAYSSYAALRNEPIWPAEPASELLSIDRTTRGQSVLFLGNTDYVAWLFHDSKVTALASGENSRDQPDARSSKPFVYGSPLDFDSVDPTTLDRTQWVVTTNTPYASQAPANFRLVRQLRLYELWRRIGPTAPRETLESSGNPGGVFDCRVAQGQALSRQHGVASVMSPPVGVPLSSIAPGDTEVVSMPLGRGTWDLSIQYVSAVDLDITAGGRHWRLTSYLDRPGPYFLVGSVTSQGRPVIVTIRADRPSSLTGRNLAAQTTDLVATRDPSTRALLPLGRACGRYVDWFRLS